MSGKSYTYSQVVDAVLKFGSLKWDLIGLKLGYTDGEINSATVGKPTHAGKLQAIINFKRDEVGEKELTKLLLEACATIPQPIIGRVKHYLDATYDPKAGVGTTEDSASKIQKSDAASLVQPTTGTSEADQVVEVDEIVKIAEAIEGFWDDFAVRLDPRLFTMAGSIQAIKRNQNFPSPNSKAQLMLEIWRDGKGTDATRRLLIETLCKMNKMKQANDVFGESPTDSVRQHKTDVSDGPLPPDKQTESVPVNVLDRLGAEGKALYEKACKKGEVKIYRVLIDVIGDEDAGKSCLGDSIMDSPYEAGKASTEGVKMRTVVRKAVGYKKDWKEVDDEQRNSLIDRLFAKEFILLKNKSTPAESVSPVKPEQQSKPGISLRSQKRDHQSHHDEVTNDGLPTAVGFDEFKSAQGLNEEVATLISLMEKNEEEIRKCEDMVVITMMDRGGQDQYLAIHAALMADNAYNASVCLFVLDGTKSLDEPLTECKFRLPDRSEIKQTRDVATTGGDLIRHWAAAVDVSRPYHDSSLPFLGKNHVKRPPATFMVATRKDETHKKERIDQVETLERRVQDIISEKMLGEHIVELRSDPYEVLFHVDNTRSGTKNPDLTVAHIRNTIVKMTQEFWDAQPPTPLPWAMLDKGLGKLAMSKYKVIDFKDVCTLARRVCDISTEEECRQALRYLCSLGTICFYHDVPGLSDKVLPNTQWVADILSVFVRVLDHRIVPPKCWQHLEDLQKEGKMAWELAEHLLQKKGINKADYSTILMLLQLFNVISPALLTATADNTVKPGQAFFVPSMVAKEFISKDPPAYRCAICSSSLPPPLFLVPKGVSAFLKPLFYRLISRMLAKYNSKPVLTRNQVVLHLDDSLELELFYTTKAVIATVYPFDSFHVPIDGVMRKHCIDVRVSLVEELKEAKRRGMDGFHFKLCVHPTAKPESPDFVYKKLACLDSYPSDPILIKERGKRIDHPKKLGLWYPYEDIHNPDMTGNAGNKLTESQIVQIASELSASWENIVLQLDPGFFDENKRRVIKGEVNTSHLQAVKALNLWRDHCHEMATQDKVINALLKAKFKAQAVKVFGNAKVNDVASKQRTIEGSASETQNPGKDYLGKPATTTSKDDQVAENKENVINGPPPPDKQIDEASKVTEKSSTPSKILECESTNKISTKGHSSWSGMLICCSLLVCIIAMVVLWWI